MASLTRWRLQENASLRTYRFRKDCKIIAAFEDYEQSTLRTLSGKLTGLRNEKVKSIYRQAQGSQGIIAMSVKA